MKNLKIDQKRESIDFAISTHREHIPYDLHHGHDYPEHPQRQDNTANGEHSTGRDKIHSSAYIGEHVGADDLVFIDLYVWELHQGSYNNEK